MPQLISTRPTALLKFVLPPFWIAAVGYAIWLLWVHPEVVLTEAGPGGTRILQWVFLALFVASLMVLYAFVTPLRRVQLAPDGLLVSNYRQEIAVPFREIAAVHQHWLPTYRLITIDLKNDTPLGRRVVFMPATARRLAFWRSDYWREDDLVRELRVRAGLPDPHSTAAIA